MRLRYGTNPHQAATIDHAPFTVVAGEPSYINVLDALTGWQLVREAAERFGVPAAASYKHVSPAGAALGETVAAAYTRARDADPKSSYGDFVAVSHPVDLELAMVLKRVVSDGIIAPGYDEGVVEILAAKKRGTYLVLEADPEFEPPAEEVRELYGVRLTQERDALPVPRDLPDDVVLGMIVARYTQSNTVVMVKDGMTIGIGAGQQSRVDCTRLAGEKAALWWARRSADPLTGVSMVSDGALPFTDNVVEAQRYGVSHIAEPGGSIRSPEVAAACAAARITWSETGIRLFRH
ncbi:phosphoribosylaminoimidazolecarboxamide formyltransferase/IMP cyclohydrolase [Kribbella sp. VKM Ac-2571]|uniref:5-aminoimidazole-4-carboxamide ribonucleotide transformylase n=1 Tax=Kribbella sp. VKM Ac-2571 TaxID=2512222 RepID=UPI00105D4781|nr:5-aminoimidazole-4-carboxamide ribonucleotide transformylase [Kribbella sp. VKM Ac-2571]TDO54207.1 phosphoribosylaminoimidazolecarboxamide formyltransferase/IMP cyclohydrolase [Kribbella sp. VKM Ac-2571]